MLLGCPNRVSWETRLGQPSNKVTEQSERDSVGTTEQQRDRAIEETGWDRAAEQSEETRLGQPSNNVKWY